MSDLFRLKELKIALSPPRNGGQPRVSSPRPSGSTLTTCAPRPARYCVHIGPASTRDRSSTRTPSSGRGESFELTASVRLGKPKGALRDEIQDHVGAHRRRAVDDHFAQQSLHLELLCVAHATERQERSL